MLYFFCETFKSAVTVKCLILFTFFHLELVCLVHNYFLFIMLIFSDYSGSEYTKMNIKHTLDDSLRTATAEDVH